MSEPLPPAIPAATVVVLRDVDDGLETLMMHRNSKIAFGGMWVFPGGRVDDADRIGGVADDEAARRAAVREAEEEAGLVIALDDLHPWAHWEPPPVMPKRFATWFFIAAAPDAEVVIDGGEIHDHAWLAPAEVLRRRDAGDVELAPPTWMTLHDLAEASSVASACEIAAGRVPMPRYVTHWQNTDGGAVALWDGDAGYETSDPTVPGGRHRLWMLEDGWRLERD